MRSKLIAGAGFAVVVVGCAALFLRGCHRAPKRGPIDFAQLSRDFAAGLEKDPFFDREADRAALALSRDELLGATTGFGGEAVRLRGLYMLVLGDIAAFADEPSAEGRIALRRSIDIYVARARLALAQSQDEASFDAKRYRANLGFLAALAWLLDQRRPDATSLDGLKQCRELDACDYGAAARAVLARTGEDDDYGTGVNAWAAGNPEQALAAFDRHLRRTADDSEALTWRGLCRLRLGKPDEALVDFDAALRLAPTDAVALEGRGHALFRTGHVDQAVAAWEDAGRRDPRRAPVLRDYARAARTP